MQPVKERCGHGASHKIKKYNEKWPLQKSIALNQCVQIASSSIESVYKKLCFSSTITVWNGAPVYPELPPVLCSDSWERCGPHSSRWWWTLGNLSWGPSPGTCLQLWVTSAYPWRTQTDNLSNWPRTIFRKTKNNKSLGVGFVRGVEI